MLVCLQSIDQLVTIHSELLQGLQSHVPEYMNAESVESLDFGSLKESLHATSVGKLFARFGQLLRLYSDFVRTFDALQDAIHFDAKLLTIFENFGEQCYLEIPTIE